MRTSIVLIYFLVFQIVLSQNEPLSLLSGIWKNDLNLTLNFIQVSKNKMTIKGTCVSSVGAIGKDYLLQGFYNWKSMTGESKDKHHVTVLSFTVHWGKSGSITTWNGYYDDKTKQIIAQWLLVRPVTQYKYEHVLIGQDRFMKQTL